jgi:hypothetical protein
VEGNKWVMGDCGVVWLRVEWNDTWDVTSTGEWEVWSQSAKVVWESGLVVYSGGGVGSNWFRARGVQVNTNAPR